MTKTPEELAEEYVAEAIRTLPYLCDFSSKDIKDAFLSGYEAALNDPEVIKKLQHACTYANCKAFQELVRKVEEAKLKWISVEDRLPDTRGDYLVLFKPLSGRLYCLVVHFLNGEQHGESCGSDWLTHEHNGSYLTHWMPLPTNTPQAD